MFSISKSVGEDTSVVSLVRLPALGDAQEDEVLLPVRPELEPLHLRQVDVSSEQTIQLLLHSRFIKKFRHLNHLMEGAGSPNTSNCT